MKNFSLSTKIVGIVVVAVVVVGLTLTACTWYFLNKSYNEESRGEMTRLAGLVQGHVTEETQKLLATAQMTAADYVVRFLPVGVGLGIFQSPNNSAVLGAVPRQRLGVASGLLAITRIVGQTAGIALLSTVWASRVLVHNGAPLPEGANSAPAAAQVAGLHDIFLVIVGLIGFGLALSVWGLVQERQARRRTAAGVEEV